MAMRVFLITLAGLVFLGCGSDELSPEDCEGDALQENFKECEGEEVFDEAFLDKIFESDDMNIAAVEVEDDSQLWDCPTDNVAHYCHYDPDVHDAECRWWVGRYEGHEGGEPTIYCNCKSAELVSDQNRESHCG